MKLRNELITLKLLEYSRLINAHKAAGNEMKATKAEDKRFEFREFCKYATDQMLLEELKPRLTDYYQLIAGDSYTLAEDFSENPLIKIPNLKKAVVACNELKTVEPKAAIYSNRYICRKNIGYHFRP